MMRTAMVVAVLAGCGGAASTATSPAGSRAGTTNAHDPSGSSLWDPVFVDGAVRNLESDMGEDTAGLSVETTDVRTIGDYQVARLRWTGGDDDGPVMVVRGAAGVQLVSPGDLEEGVADNDDALLAKIAQGWFMPETPATGPHGWRVYQAADSAAMCFEAGPEPDAGDCDDVCSAWLCVTPGVGITEVGARWAPMMLVFTASAN